MPQSSLIARFTALYVLFGFLQSVYSVPSPLLCYFVQIVDANVRSFLRYIKPYHHEHDFFGQLKDFQPIVYFEVFLRCKQPFIEDESNFG